MFSWCIKEADYFGSTTYYNICTGSQTNVPWGGFGWFELALLFALGLALLMLLFAFIRTVWKGY